MFLVKKLKEVLRVSECLHKLHEPLGSSLTINKKIDK